MLIFASLRIEKRESFGRWGGLARGVRLGVVWLAYALCQREPSAAGLWCETYTLRCTPTIHTTTRCALVGRVFTWYASRLLTLRCTGMGSGLGVVCTRAA